MKTDFRPISETLEIYDQPSKNLASGGSSLLKIVKNGGFIEDPLDVILGLSETSPLLFFRNLDQGRSINLGFADFHGGILGICAARWVARGNFW